MKNPMENSYKNEQLSENNEVIFLDEKKYKTLSKEFLQKILKVTHFSKTWNKDSNEELLFSQIAIPSLGESSYEIWLGQNNNSSIKNTIEDNVEFSESKEKTFIRIETHESENVNS